MEVKEPKEVHHVASGLWPTASRLKHSCNPNARKAFIGDMLILRATRDLPAGAEVVAMYETLGGESYKEFHDKLLKWNIICRCGICTDTRWTCQHTIIKRDKLSAQLWAATRRKQQLKQVRCKKMLSRLAKTYRRPATRIPRLGMANPQHVLANSFLDERRPDIAIKWLFKTFTSLGFVITGGDPKMPDGGPLVIRRWGVMSDFVVTCWVLLWCSYRILSKPELSRQARQLGRTAYLICMGEDETFEAKLT